MRSMEEKRIKKKNMWKFILIIVAIVLIVTVGIYLYIKYETYDYMQISETYPNSSTDNANYKQCMNGILRYGRDGIALLTNEGEEAWNQSCQMSNPVVEICGNSVAVGDKGGTSILVFQKKGLKGEIQTTRPIEKISVSSQGIVSAILRDEETPLIMCYDAKGNVLIEHKVSLKNMGYPVDVAISKDGNTMLVSYLYTQGNEIVTKIVYYYFGSGEKEDYQVQYQELNNAVVPVTAFVDEDTSLVVADSTLIFYEGLEKPEESKRVEIKNEIQSVAYDDKTVAVILKSGDTSDYKLNIYNTQGKMLSSVDVDKEYTNIKVIDGQVIMYDGQICSIYMKNGIHKYEGKMDENILEIFPTIGLNKYMMINASGFHKVELAKIGEE